MFTFKPHETYFFRPLFNFLNVFFEFGYSFRHGGGGVDKLLSKLVSHCSVSGFLGLIASFFKYKIRIVRISVNSFLHIFYGAEFFTQLNFEGPGTVSMLLKIATFSHTTDNDGTNRTDESNLTAELKGREQARPMFQKALIFR